MPVKSTDTEINEKSAAAFVEYGRQFGKVFAQAGLRYEHLKNDYFNFGKREDEVCRDFNLRRLGMLTLDVRCVDVLNTNKTAAVIYGIRELSTDNPARRTFLVNLNWKFNEARSKYRGSGAGEKQKARM